MNPAPRTQVLGYPPNDGGNQKWNLTLESTEGESGFYTFTALDPVRSVFVNAQNIGNGLTSEVFTTTFNVTEVGGATGFTITIPLTDPVLAVTAAFSATQLTLEPHDPDNGFQIWTFDPVGLLRLARV
ncbi:hypothetical protein AURDEDRAFT_167596 [Auricularia subglabra TFB-10046 SS5]|nr:hypothetical protein AURDEDRAFT_167596 [Auricularia subglabra TFB-10046 SS5]